MAEQQKKVRLARGGVIINTKVGAVQFGIPPETIKDCMTLGIPIPNIFVFPSELVDRHKGVNVAEAEFPAYFNFFILKKVVNFVCTVSQEKRMREVFQQTLLGPKEFNLKQEYPEGYPADHIPDLAKECAYIRTFHAIDELFKFHHFDEHGVADLGSGVEIKLQGDDFVVYEDKKEFERTPTKVQLAESLWQGSYISAEHPKPFDPPLFGVTILGSGHGFDPSNHTSGFVLWMNKRGIMVDPPLNSRGLLQRAGVPSRLIDCVIITHCHADHDQGTLQKILEESQVTLMTTPTIMNSFLKKYSALTGLTEDFLRRLFIYRPAVLAEPFRFNGGEFRFFYSIHTIPCIGFEVYYGGKSIYFSGDTCYDPVLISKMAKDGALRPGRAQFWLNRQWHHNIILHEAGVPPIHTPISVLADLPADVKKRLYLIHTSKKAVPSESQLKIAPEGVQSTMVLDVTPHVHSEAIELLKTVDSIDMFRVFSLSQARELLQIAMPRKYPCGSCIIEKGSVGEEFFIITAGIVTLSDGLHWSKNLLSGDYFGEMSLVTGAARSASALAKTDVDVIAFRKEDFLSILRGNSETIDFILNLAERRREPSWQIITKNNVFCRMTNSQKTRLQAAFVKKDFKKGDVIWKNGAAAAFAMLVGDGELEFENKPELLEPFKEGAFVGETNALLHNGNNTTTLKALTDGWGYIVSKADWVEFLNRNPGIKLSFLDITFVDILQEDQLKLIQSIKDPYSFAF